MTNEFHDAWEAHHNATCELFEATQRAFPVGVVVAWMKGPDHNVAEVIGHKPPCTLCLRYGSGGKAWVDAIKVKEIVGAA